MISRSSMAVPATVTFVDLDGNVVGTETATYEAGATVRFVYPGAPVDAAGNAVDWPGWMFDGNVWVHDPSDAHLRDGLTVVVEVNPTATGSVTLSGCHGGLRRSGDRARRRRQTRSSPRAGCP